MVNAQTFQKLYLLLPFAYPPTPAPSSFSPWDYDQPASWGDNYPTCNGNRQSPIQITTFMSYVLPLPTITFGYYDIPLAGNIALSNNGHSVELEVPATTNGRRPYISGGLLKSRYEAMAVHFHWGSKGNKGSEHVIDNRRYDVEMHIVHKNVRYATMTEASENRDGISVLGIMLKIVRSPDRFYPGLNKIFNKLPQVTNYKSNATINGQLSVAQLLGDLNTKQFYTYSGSLTTPNCAEAVTWVVFPDPLAIAFEQIRKFWTIRGESGDILVNNFRPIQNRNKRPVFYRVGSFKDSNFISGQYHT